MKMENYSLKSQEEVTRSSGWMSMIQEYLHEKAEGLNIFEKVMLTLYSLMTLFFLFSAVFFVLTKGFKY